MRANRTDVFSLSDDSTSYPDTVLRLRLGSPIAQWEQYIAGWQAVVVDLCGVDQLGPSWRLHSLQVDYLQRLTFVLVPAPARTGVTVQVSVVRYAGGGRWSDCRSFAAFEQLAVSVSPYFDRVLVATASPSRALDPWTLLLFNTTLLAPLYYAELPRSPAVLAASNPNADFVVTTVSAQNSTVYRLAFNLRPISAISLPLFSVLSLVPLGTGDLVFTAIRGASLGAELCIVLESQLYPMYGPSPASPLAYLYPTAYDSFSLYDVGRPLTQAQVYAWQKTLVSSTGGQQPTYSTAVAPTGQPLPPQPSLYPFYAQTPQPVDDPLQRTPFRATNFTHLFSISNSTSNNDNVVWALGLRQPQRWEPFVGGWQQQLQRACGLGAYGVSWRLQSLQARGQTLTVVGTADVSGAGILYTVSYEPFLAPGSQWSACKGPVMASQAAVTYDPRADRALVVSFTPNDHSFLLRLYNSSLAQPLAINSVSRDGSSTVSLATSPSTYWVGVPGAVHSTLYSFGDPLYLKAWYSLRFFTLEAFVPLANGDVVFTGTNTTAYLGQAAVPPHQQHGHPQLCGQLRRPSLLPLLRRRRPALLLHLQRQRAHQRRPAVHVEARQPALHRAAASPPHRPRPTHRSPHSRLPLVHRQRRLLCRHRRAGARAAVLQDGGRGGGQRHRRAAARGVLHDVRAGVRRQGQAGHAGQHTDGGAVAAAGAGHRAAEAGAAVAAAAARGARC